MTATATNSRVLHGKKGRLKKTPHKMNKFKIRAHAHE